MKTLSKFVKDNPQLKSDRSEYLKLAVKEGDAVRGTGLHKVKVIDCKNAVNKDYRTQKEIQGVELIFEENGEQKKYFVPTLGNDGKFHYLIEKFADIPEGTELTLEYQRKPGSAKGFINVQLANEKEVVEPLETTDEEIPVINEDETTATTPEEEFGL